MDSLMNTIAISSLYGLDSTRLFDVCILVNIMLPPSLWLLYPSVLIVDGPPNTILTEMLEIIPVNRVTATTVKEDTTGKIVDIVR